MGVNKKGITMDTIMQSLAGLDNFALYFGLSIVFLFIFKLVYALVTPHDEWKLVKEEKNVAAAIGLGSAASNSVAVVDFAIWALVAVIAQSLAFAILRFSFMPKIAERINNNEVSAGVMLASMSIAVGLLNAACMTY